jgi:branched-chain amino acid transport system permease protein
MAFVYWELKVDLGIQTLVAFLLTVLVAAPLFGLVIERLLMRPLAEAPLVAQLVTTIGLMLALIGLAATIWNPNTTRSIGTFFGTSGFHIGETFMPWYRLITIASGLLIALFLKFLLSRTRLGISMRSVVDNRDLAALNGARVGQVSMTAWMLGSSMAAVAGIFLAQELSTLDVQTLTLLIVDAFAAAIIGRLRSFPLTYVGGIIIGLALSFQQNFLNWTGRWTTASTAIPTVILFLALLFLPQARLEISKAARMLAPRVPRFRTAVIAMLVLIAAVVIVAGVMTRVDVRRLDVALVTAITLVSLVPLTGWTRQISLGQITFVGVGAFAFAIWGAHLGGVGALVVAAAFAIPFGALMCLPALRLQGLYLALASMAFARMAEFLFFAQPEVFGSSARIAGSITILGFDFSKPFTLFGIHYGQDVGTLFLSTVLFALVGLGVVRMRTSAFGRRLVALGDSEAACATLGVNEIQTKFQVWVLSAAIAGFSGALFAAALGSASTQDFQMLVGLPYILLAVVGGIAVVSGALLGGLLLQSFTWYTELFPSVIVSVFGWFSFNLFNLLQALGPGLAGIGVGRQPSGIIPTTGAKLRERRSRRSGPPEETPVAVAAAPAGDGAPSVQSAPEPASGGPTPAPGPPPPR